MIEVYVMNETRRANNDTMIYDGTTHLTTTTGRLTAAANVRDYIYTSTSVVEYNYMYIVMCMLQIPSAIKNQECSDRHHYHHSLIRRSNFVRPAVTSNHAQILPPNCLPLALAPATTLLGVLTSLPFPFPFPLP